jgi:Nuclease-related domain
MEFGMSTDRSIRLRYPAVCSVCGRDLPSGTNAFWSRAERAATCLECSAAAVDAAELSKVRTELPALDRGVAGGSGRREQAKRRERREQHARQKLGRLGGVYLALTNEAQSTQAWGIGAVGEEKLGAFLNTFDNDRSLFVLHDRRIPGSRANIDHIVVSARRVFVIDAKRYSGTVRKVDKGGWFSTDHRLYVGGRDRTRLVDGMAKQVAAVRGTLGEPMMEEFELRLTPVLCFVEADWPLFARPFQLGGVWVDGPKSLAKRIEQPGHLEPEHVRALAKRVAAALPPKR